MHSRDGQPKDNGADQKRWTPSRTECQPNRKRGGGNCSNETGHNKTGSMIHMHARMNCAHTYVVHRRNTNAHSEPRYRRKIDLTSSASSSTTAILPSFIS